MTKITKLALAALPFVAMSGPSLAQDVTITLQSAFPTSLPVVNTIRQFEADVEAASGGTIQIELAEPGAIVPPFDIQQAVSDGEIEAGYTAAAYLHGSLPVASFFTSMPFGPQALDYMAWFYEGGGLELNQRMYDDAGFDLVTMPVTFTGMESGGWFNTPIEGTNDFAGLKLRWSGLASEVLASLGADTVLIEGGEIFPSLESGIIDGTEFSFPQVDLALGFPHVASFNYFPGWHQPSTMIELVINRDVWDGLTDSQRTIIDMAARTNAMRSVLRMEYSQAAAVAQMAEQGVDVRLYSPETLDSLRVAWDALISEMAAADPFVAEVWNSLQAARTQEDAWDALTETPRQRP